MASTGVLVRNLVRGRDDRMPGLWLALLDGLRRLGRDAQQRRAKQYHSQYHGSSLDVLCDCYSHLLYTMLDDHLRRRVRMQGLRRSNSTALPPHVYAFALLRDLHSDTRDLRDLILFSSSRDTKQFPRPVRRRHADADAGCPDLRSMATHQIVHCGLCADGSQAFLLQLGATSKSE